MEALISEPRFDLDGRVRQLVSWFGIVREVDHPLGQRGGSLLLENKYFNGRTDEHLQTVSIRGGGDFRVELPFLSEQFVPLTLVRVDGRVSRNENGLPVVTPRYIRAWNWGQFNFDDYGEDRSNPLLVKRLGTSAAGTCLPKRGRRPTITFVACAQMTGRQSRFGSTSLGRRKRRRVQSKTCHARRRLSQRPLP